MDGKENQKILQKLDNNELDVIVQVRMLGEGFDHPFLSVAAVCSIFSNLSPFAQFVGRIMRVIDNNDKNSPNNQGIVIYHAGANIAKRWSDFQVFSEADQDYFDQLLPVEEVDFTDSNELTCEPHQRNLTNPIEIREQNSVTIEERPLLKDDFAAINRVAELLSGSQSIEVAELLHSKGVQLSPIPVTKQKRRLASKKELDDMVKTKASFLLNKHSINPQGKELDTKHLGKTNFVIVKSAIDKKCNALVNKESGQRYDFSQIDLDKINTNLDKIVNTLEKEIFNG